VEQGRPKVKAEVKGGHAYDIPINYLFYDYLKAYRGRVTPNSQWPKPDPKRRQLDRIRLTALLPNLSGWRRADNDMFIEPGSKHVVSIQILSQKEPALVPETREVFDRSTMPSSLPLNDVPLEYRSDGLIYRRSNFITGRIYFYSEANDEDGKNYGFCDVRTPSPYSTPHCYFRFHVDGGDVVEIGFYYPWFKHRWKIINDVRKLIASFEAPYQRE
jgi:hypothetical protein